MTELPHVTSNGASSYSFQTSRDSIKIYTEGPCFKVEVTDGYRDAFYKLTPYDVETLAEAMGMLPHLGWLIYKGMELQLAFLYTLAEIVKQARADEFHMALYNNVKPEYVWLSGF